MEHQREILQRALDALNAVCESSRATLGQNPFSCAGFRSGLGSAA